MHIKLVFSQLQPPSLKLLRFRSQIEDKFAKENRFLDDKTGGSVQYGIPGYPRDAKHMIPTYPNQQISTHTLPETNMAPDNWWLEDEFPFGMAYFQGLLLLVSGRVSTHINMMVGRW